MSSRFIKHPNRGFSIIELLVSIAIIGIITALVMVRYGAFNSAVLLKSQAYEIALDVREAQSFAISVRGDGSEFRQEYGLFFTTGNRDGANKNGYAFFQDNQSSGSSDKKYTSGEIVGPIRTLDPRFEISNVTLVGCGSGTTGELSITFQRPNFDAQFKNGSNCEAITEATITIRSVSDTSATRSIVITSTGQVTVE